MTHTIARHRQQPHTATHRAVVDETSERGGVRTGAEITAASWRMLPASEPTLAASATTVIAAPIVSPLVLCKRADAQETGGLRRPAQKRLTQSRVRYGLIAAWSLLATSFAAAEPIDVSADLVAVAKQHKVHALAVAVIEGSQLIKLGATGIRANGHEAKVTVEDLWHIGSCTKAMTATVCARLVEKGLLRWDLTLGESLVKDVERIHLDLRAVTLEQLLSHRAGLLANPPTTVMRKMLASGEGRAARELLVTDGILEKPLEHKPDTKYLYSNFGFMLAGMMAERATDKEWETLMREELFEPLGMKSAGFGPPGTADVVDQPRGHGLFGNSLPPGPQADNPRGLGPAGTVHCSMADWSKFVALHLQAARGESRLLKQESFQKLHTPRGNDKDQYALGWIVADRPWAGGQVLMHNGSNTHWFVVTWLAPKKNMAFMAASNVGPAAGAAATDAAVVVLLQQAGLIPKPKAAAAPPAKSVK